MACKIFRFIFISLFLLLPHQFFGKSITIYRENNLYGLLDDRLNVVVKAEYGKCSVSNKNEYFFLDKKKNTNTCCIINRLGEICWKGTEIDYVEPVFGEYFFDIRQKSDSVEFVLINAKSQSEKKLKGIHEIFPVRNSSECPNSFSVRNDNKGFVYDLNLKSIRMEKELGEQNNPLVFPEIDGMLAYGRGKGIVNSKGKVILKDLIDCGYNSSQGLMPVLTKTKSGFVNKNGDFVFECPIFLEASGGGSCPGLSCNFSEGYAYVPYDRFEGAIYTLKGKVVKSKLPYCTNSVYSDGWICVYNQNGKYNFLSYQGDKISAEYFDYAESFVNGYAVISIDGIEALIDKNGKILK